jgi:serine protease Do
MPIPRLQTAATVWKRWRNSPARGVVISEVKPGRPAATAGLRPGMLISQINRESGDDVEAFQEALAESSTTKQVLLLVEDRRGGRYVALSLG